MSCPGAARPPRFAARGSPLRVQAAGAIAGGESSAPQGEPGRGGGSPGAGLEMQPSGSLTVRTRRTASNGGRGSPVLW